MMKHFFCKYRRGDAPADGTPAVRGGQFYGITTTTMSLQGPMPPDSFCQQAA
jgi:hypothetical protein